ncbi:restriction endonuclease subunit S [Lactococcus lactis]|nr:restriction endonuclease subunit S [Lactococcus lactis]
MSKKRPQLRFKGFTDDWEEHKLGDFLKTPEKVKAHIQSKDDLMTLKLNLGGLESGSNRETLELGSTIYYKRKAGQFIYGKQNFFNGSMAIIPIDLDGKATSGDVPSLDVIGILSEYLYVYVSRGDYWKSKESEASGTGSKRIHEKTLQGFDIKVPSTQNEQRKIGSFFKQLDDTIALHQRKLDLLKEQKKGYLQKMFPKNGSKIPELRFEGFTGDWQERKLGDLLDEGVILSQSDGNHGELYPKSSEFAKSGIPYLSASNLKNNEIDYSEVKYLPIDRAEKFKKGVAKKGDVLLAHNATVGPSVLLRTDYPFVILSTTLTLYRINEEKMDNIFFLNSIRSSNIQNQLKKMMKQTTRNQVPILAQRTMTICYSTDIKEQKKIGSFFSLLDNTIALHQRKLDLLKEQKKGFLQKMFI